jgi:hypothetical protein
MRAARVARLFFDEVNVMTTPHNVILIPIAVPVANGWLRRCRPPEYPREARERWPHQRQAVPVRDMGQVRRMLADAKKMIAEQRTSKLLKELDR